jgi:hypothetical protein
MRLRGLRLGVVGSLCAMAGALALCGASAMGAGDANQASCPNEASPGFRAYLPDCRAYEMVTPPYKSGGFVTVFKTGWSGEEALG